MTPQASKFPPTGAPHLKDTCERDLGSIGKIRPFLPTTFLVLLLLLNGCSPQELQSVLGGAAGSPLSNEEAIAGLKEALRVGAERGVDKAGAENGFWNDARIRIPFPQEAIKVKNTLIDLGMQQQVDKFERTLNNAAELASREAVNVFIQAVNGMTIQDGISILRGGDDAATRFLRDRTSDTLRTRFMPIVERATSRVALAEHWRPLANTYNASTLFTGNEAIDPDLNAYVTERALDGLFLLLAEEEQRIREDPLARTSAILERVFGRKW